eukprot:3273174-Amphidinium_carterae.1
MIRLQQITFRTLFKTPVVTADCPVENHLAYQQNRMEATRGPPKSMKANRITIPVKSCECQHRFNK